MNQSKLNRQPEQGHEWWIPYRADEKSATPARNGGDHRSLNNPSVQDQLLDHNQDNNTLIVVFMHDSSP
jgi:hypothetical protein